MTDSPRQGTKRQRDLKLELTWVGKDHRPRLEPRILLEDPEKNYHAAARVTDADQFENMLIFGDNLLALQSLATDPKVKGKVKCIFIDPPYNTGSAFEHYDDGMEHSLWLSMMRERLELLRELLSNDGSIWISIDDNEAHYLKVLCDEIFGRRNFVADVIWQKKYSPQNNAIWLSDSHDHIVCYALNKEIWRPVPLPRSEEMDARYKNPDNDPRGDWKASDFTIGLTSGQRGAQFARTGYSPNLYEIVTPSGRKVSPPNGRCWLTSEERFKELLEDNRIYFGPDGSNVPAQKRFLSEVQAGSVAKTIWLRDEVGDNQEAKKEVTVFNNKNVFATPKPERLMQRIIHLATQPGDIVLDSFAGSGTTGAVAHKMGRRWIMVELGEHAHTHIIPRMQKVIDGSDQGGISQAVGWKGGGGFRYFKLAPTLIKKDRRGNEIINPEYNAEMLAEACCKLKGFAFEPSTSRELWWQQGRSSERDFLFVTTRYMDYASLQDLSEEVGPERTLLVLVKAYDREGEVFDNLTLEKIPESVLHLAEWDKDDYSLKVENLPKAAPDKELVTTAQRAERRGSRSMAGVPNLFAAAGDDS